MRTALKGIALVFVALVIAAMPTRLGSHDVAIGFPFTWYARHEIVTLGEQPLSFSFFPLLWDFCIAFLVLAVVVKLFRTRRA